MAITAILSFAYNVWAARALGRVQYADFAAALAIVAILGYALNPLALVTAQLASTFFASGETTRIASLYRAMQRRLRHATIAAAIPAVLAGLAAAHVFRFGSRVVLALAAVMVAVLLFLAITRATLRATQHFNSYARGLVGEALMRLALGIPLLWISPTASYALAAYLVSAVTIFTVQDRALKRCWRDLPPAETTETASSGVIGPGWGLLIWYALAQNIDLLIIKSLAERSDAGVYAAAATIVRSLMVVLTLPLDAVLLPRLGAAATQVRAVAGSVGSLFLALWMLPVAALVLFPRALVTLVFGVSFASAAPLVPWLALAALCMSASYLCGQALLFLIKRRFLLLLFVGLGIEIPAVVLFAGDLERTAIAIFTVQAVVAAGVVLLFMRASAPARTGQTT